VAGEVSRRHGSVAYRPPACPATYGHQVTAATAAPGDRVGGVFGWVSRR